MQQIIATPTIPKEDLLQPEEAIAKQVIDGEYIEVDLPSNFVFYPFKHLYIKPFKMKHIRKLIQGQTNKNVHYMAQVLNSCIKCEQPIKDLVYHLTQEDFTYLMYWERLHSMPNMQYNYRCHCNNPQHIKDVEQGKASEKSLVFVQPISKSTLHTDFLDKEQSYSIDQSKYISPEFKQAYPTAKVKIPLLKDYLDMLDLAEKELVQDDEEGQIWFLTGVAACRLSITNQQGQELSFKERFDILDNLDPESFYMFKDSEQVLPAYGVNEFINAKCPKCGAVTKTRVVLTAHSFLPSVNNARSA